MQKVTRYKCPECKKVYNSLATWTNHVMKYHPQIIPEGYTPARYFYYLQTGKTGNKCIICKEPTEWNEATGKYERFCKNPECKKKYKEAFQKRMIGKYGKVSLLDDPNQQRKMLEAKKNHGYYKFADGGKIGYSSTYEKDFLKMLDTFLHINSASIMGPSPHTYYYQYKNPEDKSNEGKKFYIPDFFIPSLGLEIEIKQNTSTHPKILAIDKVKEAQKDEMMKTIKEINYIKIVDKDYSEFYNLLLQLRETMPENTEGDQYPDDIATEALRRPITGRVKANPNFNMAEIKSFITKATRFAYKSVTPEGYTIDEDDNQTWLDTYRVLNPEQVNRFGGGICWDMAGYVYDWCLKKGYNPTATYVMLQYPPNYTTHTFVTIPNYPDGGVLLLEASYKRYAGVKEFLTMEACVQWVVGAMIHDEHAPEATQFMRTIYDPRKCYGMTPQEFMNYQSMHSLGVFKHKKGTEYRDITLESIVDAIHNSIIYEKGDFKAVMEVVNSLTREELLHICGGTFKESPNVIFRRVAYDGTRPIGFVEVYDLPKYHSRKFFQYHADIVLAVNLAYRGRHIAKNLMLEVMKAFSTDPKLQKYALVYTVDNDNKDSMGLAEAIGFGHYMTTKNQTIYVHNAPSDSIPIQNGILYHGSSQKIEEIRVNVSTHKVPVVYASPSYQFALCFAGGKWDDFSINQAMNNGMITLTEIKKGAFKEFLDCPGYVYKLKNDGSFKQLYTGVNTEYVTDKPVKPAGVIEIRNVLKELQKQNNVNLIYYPNLPPWIPDRDQYIRDKKKRFGIESTFAEESIFDFFHKSSEAEKQAVIDDWKQKIFGDLSSALVGGKPTTSKYVTFNKVIVDDKRGIISIQNINIPILIQRIRDTFGEHRLDYIFDRTYKAGDITLFNKKRLSRSQMRVTSLTTPTFFALELTILFRELYAQYHYGVYAQIANDIYRKSWLSKADRTPPQKIDMSRLRNLNPKYTPQPYQKEFLELYPSLKTKLGLRGYYLAFDQGLGKTLTASMLAEVVEAERVFIVCPNTLRAVWESELKDYFQGKYKSYICGTTMKGKVTDYKYFIVNNENIKTIMPYTNLPGRKMLIVDEAHNFRNYTGERVTNLVKLREALEPEDILLLSGTPIKAIPSEIVPALILLDPNFTPHAAEIYNSCFKFDSYLAMDIVRQRFGQMIYRKTKDEVLALPNKYVEDIRLMIKDPEPYILENVRDAVKQYFWEFYEEMAKDDKQNMERFSALIRQYSTANHRDTEYYLRLVIRATDREHDKEIGGVDLGHELTQEFFDTFIQTYIANNGAIPKPILNELYTLEKKFIRMKNSAMGRAIGKVYPPRRTLLFNALFDENIDLFTDMIMKNPTKTVIFSQLLPVVNHICDALNNRGIHSVKIVGGMKDRMEVINAFRESDDIKVIIATSQTMGTGVTLTEANQMFFFGPPWRSTDYDQCCDRIYRIGQKKDVYIYNVRLDTPKMNLSDRMNKILAWSAEMFHSAIDTTLEEDAAFEAMLPYAEEALLKTQTNILDGAKYKFPNSRILLVTTNGPSSAALHTIGTSTFNKINEFKVWAGKSSVVFLTPNGIYNAIANNNNYGANGSKPYEVYNSIIQGKSRRIDSSTNTRAAFAAALDLINEWLDENPDWKVLVDLNRAELYAHFQDYPMIRISYGKFTQLSQAMHIGIQEGKAYYKRANNLYEMTENTFDGKGRFIEYDKDFKLYHISDKELKELTPRSSYSPLLKENVTFARVSAAPTIDDCLYAMPGREGIMYVHELLLTPEHQVFKPNKKMVPDAEDTNEYWVLNPVKVKVIQKLWRIYVYDIGFKTFPIESKVKINGKAYTLKVDGNVTAKVGYSIFSLYAGTVLVARMRFQHGRNIIDQLIVTPKYRHKGIGSALLNYLITDKNFASGVFVDDKDEEGAKFLDSFMLRIKTGKNIPKIEEEK